jgi:hypothetical protein
MKIEYTITKKRGNWRPILAYKVIKEQWEIDLAVPGVYTDIRVPKGHDYVHSVLPGDSERGSEHVEDSAALKLPPHDTAAYDAKIILPWRPGAHPEYPEVHQAMRDLMTEWERRVAEAMDSGEVSQQFLVEPSEDYREKTQGYAVAATLARQKP